MQRLIRAVSGVVGVSVLTIACTPAQPPAATSTRPSPQTAQSVHVPLAGAWSPVDPFAPDVQEAARFAVQTFAVQNRRRILYKDVVQARQQVVAGLNFQLDLQVMQEGVVRSAQVIVWHQPDGHYKLSEWVWRDR